MTDNNQERNQEAFAIFMQKVKTILNGVRMSKEFEEIMANCFVLGMTPEESVNRFCEGKNKELTNQ